MGVEEHDRLIGEIAELRRKCERGETTLQQVQVALAGIEAEMRHLRQEAGDFVTRAEHTPVRNIVYGVVGLIGASLVGALMVVLIGAPK